MTAIISTNYNDKYLWYLPIVTWCWNKLGVDVIVFMPDKPGWNFTPKGYLIYKTAAKMNFKTILRKFNCPEHKEATYAQCSRLYAACLDLPEDETLITSDVDMLVFNKDYFQQATDGIIDIYGSDLVPPLQYPMCYISGNVKTWRDLIGSGSYQEHLDKLLGEIECDNFRGNYWAKDQEEIYRLLHSNDNVDYRLHKRARPETQFAEKRYDRDDAYLLERLSLDTIDYHLPRPGYEENNFNQILSVLTFHYPQEDFTWLINYRNEYLKLL